MRAYAIYAGGGVKGAALAGCLRAAEQQGVKFIGHGGTSAGSMVAVMAAVGYDGQALEKILVDELEFSDLLEDRGQRLGQVRATVDKISLALSAGSWAGKAWAVNVRAPGVLKNTGAGPGD